MKVHPNRSSSSHSVLSAAVSLMPRDWNLLSSASAKGARTLIAAPPSTKNSKKSRDPEMKQTRKGNQWYFGMKAHIGADAESGCVHSAEITSANVHDSVVTDTLLHGEEEIAFGDSAYRTNERSLDADRDESDVVWATPFKRTKTKPLTEEQRRINRLTSSYRSKVEHVFRIVKRQFGYAKTRYRGLYKNGQQIFCLLALANIYIVRDKLLQPTG